MERDIFEGAKFGDRFKTNDGRIAIYHKNEMHKGELWHYLIIEPEEIKCSNGDSFINSPYAAYRSKNGKGYPEYLNVHNNEDGISPNHGSLIVKKLS